MKFIQTLYQTLAQHMPEETILIAQTMGEGRRLLRQCADSCGLLMGVRPATVRSLALELTAPCLGAEEGPRLMENVEAGDTMLRCLKAMPSRGFFAGEHAKDRTTAELMLRVIDELNRNHIGPIGGNDRQDAVQALREAYSRAKGDALLDQADLLDLAIEQAKKGCLPEGRHYVVLSSSLFGRQERELLDLLTAGRLAVVPVELPEGIAVPGSCYDSDTPRRAVDASAFRFVSCRGEETEQRFVFRDMLESGRPAENCAVIALNRELSAGLFDRALYYGVPAMVTGGSPAAGSRLYHALSVLNSWEDAEFDAEQLRGLLANHALSVPEQGRLIRRLRDKAVGWSRQRYYDCLLKTDGEENPPEPETLDRWRAFLELLFAAAQKQGSPEEQKKLLEQLLADYIPVSNGAEASALAAAEARLQHISWLDEEETVLGRLLELLEKTGVQSGHEEAGCLYVTNLNEGFCTGRQTLYVCGLSRFCLQSRAESPLLLDEEKLAYGLPTLQDREREELFRFQLMLLQHEGQVVLSYSDYDTERMIPLQPAPVYRQLLGKRSPEQVSFVARTDYSLGEYISRGGSLDIQRQPPVPAPEELAPAQLGERRKHREVMGEMRFSPTSLEEALACPFKFWFKRLAGLWPAELPEHSSDTWLNPAELGVLCHTVLEKYYKNTEDGLSPADRLSAIFEGEMKTLRLTHTPAPESTILRDRKRAWQMIRRAIQWTEENSASVVSTEQKFGRQAEQEPILLQVGGRELRLSGSIDRVDRMLSGETAILDYKTGSAKSYKEHPERYLQPYLYALAAEQLNPALRVTESGYLFLRDGADYLPVPQSPEARREKEFAVASLLAWLEDEEQARLAAPAFVCDAKSGCFRPGSAAERRKALEGCSKYCDFAGSCPAERQIQEAEAIEAEERGAEGHE